MSADGHWHPTKIGLEYVKYNRDSFQVEYPVRIARPVDNGKTSKRMEWQLDKFTFEYKRDPDQEFTVGQIRVSGQLALESNKQAHIRDAAHQFIQTRRTLLARDPDTNEINRYHIVSYSSPKSLCGTQLSQSG